jgi:hypothetical protein
MLVVTLVSHCEQVWWDSGYDSLRVAVGAVVDLQAEAAHMLGSPVSSTFCTFVDHYETPARVDAREAPDVCEMVVATGNELGLHVHAHHSDGDAESQERLAAADADAIAELGFPRPATYTAGDWVASADLAAHLVAAGFRVDCSVYALEGPIKSDGLTIDHTRRADLRPYHPHERDLWSEGTSELVELPVSGCLTEFGCGALTGLPPIEERIAERLESSQGSVDVFQIFWHPFDVVTLDGRNNNALLAAGVRVGRGRGAIAPNDTVLSPYSEFVRSFGARDGAVFSGAAAAAAVWEESRSRKV